ncbi:hypothetical protein MTR_5g074810 [Medicago truncatula]|uniref:Uncharacterized protein n=1 Tax=Medicago truncatula TaxID=3880 RepID=G7KFL3_MEDTR|nr:hypothetical protein MTR_5g074810 [Medicago truncatula]
MILAFFYRSRYPGQQEARGGEAAKFCHPAASVGSHASTKLFSCSNLLLIQKRFLEEKGGCDRRLWTARRGSEKKI